MTPATVGLAAELGLQLSNVLWDGVFAVIIAFVLLCALAAVFFGMCIADARRVRRPQAGPVPGPAGCPCCTAAPYTVNDCTCREDCGVHWCQAADYEPECPWCTPGNDVIDSTLCRCEAPCGRGYCKAPAVSRG